MAGTHFLPRLNPWVSMRVNFYDRTEAAVAVSVVFFVHNSQNNFLFFLPSVLSFSESLSFASSIAL